MSKAPYRAVGVSAAMLALAAIAWPLSAAAQETPDCDNAMTQSEMTRCADLDWQKADAELNTVYKKAMAKMRETDSYLPDDLKGAADTLRDAQRAWIPYRDKACEAYGFLARGGTMEPMLVYGCRADLTRQRVTELQSLAEGLGN
ncbi:lysozyme inhibitor LprI family protein [Roseibium sp. Sym1]|uniref:lysozyme inhibitor LprI family protein n=1 Tax=Roseibium sp. Sym1 TaxID=3016006 RepID=UPI0022B2C962|nr:lysozyme inhibitor LprI family protein [Roseibium sp. Sym1]